MSEISELTIYKDLITLVEREVKVLVQTPVAPLDELKILTQLYCMLKDNLREDMKHGVWEKLQAST